MAGGDHQFLQGCSMGRPFPRFCPTCGKYEVRPATIDYTIMEVRIPNLHVNKCDVCDEFLFGNVADDQITEALKVKP